MCARSRLSYGQGWIVFCLICSLCGATLPCCAAETSPPAELFRDGDAIVFFGDSITQAGHYIDHFEAWLCCRFPQCKFRVLDRGINSETISGASETDHDPRRPWAHDRFARDIVPLKPQVLIACFGMNDGNYHPFEWGRFEQYQRGVRRLMQRAADEAGVRTLILLTPPPFDPYQRTPLDPAAREFGYKFPAVDYDQTLQKYSEWLVSLRDDAQLVVDMHSTLNRHVGERRREQVSFTVIPDSIHPNMTGHWLMALEMLRQLSVAGPPLVTIWNEEVPAEGWQKTADIQGFAPLDPQVDPISVEREAMRGNAFRWQQLGWSKILNGKSWRLSVDSYLVGEYSSDELRRGISVPLPPESNVTRQRQELLVKIRERRTLEYWHFRSGTDKPLGSTPPHADIPNRIAELTGEIELLRQPVPCQVRLEPVN